MANRGNWWITFLMGVLLLLGFTPVTNAAEVELKWLSVPDCDGYRVYYGTNTDNKNYSINVGQAVRCSVKNLDCGETYYFEIKAYNEKGDSPPTQTVHATIPECVPDLILPEGWELKGVEIVPKQ